MRGGIEGLLGLCLLGSVCSDGGMAQGAPAGGAPGELAINVWVYNYARASRRTLKRARAIAGDVFRRAGVELEWLDWDPGTDRTRAEPTGPTDLFLRVLPKTDAAGSGQGDLFGMVHLSEEGGVYRIANVYLDNDRTIFLHRVTELTRERRPARFCRPATVLGHLIAHELGHLLLGRGSHSPAGITSKPWHTTHLRLAAKGQLVFTEEQAQQIRAALGKRLGAKQASTDSRVPR